MVGLQSNRLCNVVFFVAKIVLCDIYLYKKVAFRRMCVELFATVGGTFGIVS